MTIDSVFEDLIPMTTTNDADLKSLMTTDAATEQSISSSTTTSTEISRPRPSINENAITILNFVSQLQQTLSTTIEDLLRMNAVQLNDILTDADSDNLSVSLVDQATDYDGKITIPQLFEALNKSNELGSLLLGFASVLDEIQNQKLAISEVQNFVGSKLPLLRAAIKQIISARQDPDNIALPPIIDNFKQTLANIYADGLDKFAQGSNGCKLKAFNEIGPDQDGQITTAQFIEYASQIALVSDDDITQMCLIADPEGSGKINYEQFSIALNAQFLGKSIITKLCEHVCRIKVRDRSFISTVANDTPNAEMFSGDVISDDGILALDSAQTPQNDYTQQLPNVHSAHGHHKEPYMMIGALLVLVVILVVFIMCLMCKPSRICLRKRKYAKAATNEGGSEDELL